MYRAVLVAFVVVFSVAAASAQSTAPISVTVNIPDEAAITATNTDGLDSQSAGIFAIGGNWGIKATGGRVGGVFTSQTGTGLQVSGYAGGLSGTCGSSSCTAVNGISYGGAGVLGRGPMGVVGVALPWPAGFTAPSWAGYFQGDLHVDGAIDAPIIQQLQTANAALQSSIATLTAQLAALVTATGTPGILPHAVPGRIEAEDYDQGGKNVGYFDTTPGNEYGSVVYRNDDVDIKPSAEGGYAIGWMTAGEWLAYTVNVPSDGLYGINVRIGSALPGRTFHIEVNGQDATGPVGVPQMADWDQYDTVSIASVALHAGRQTLRFVVGSDAWVEFQWFEVR